MAIVRQSGYKMVDFGKVIAGMDTLKYGETLRDK